MKTLKYSPLLLVLLGGIFLGGCYTTIYVRDPGSYSRNNNTSNNSYSDQDTTYNYDDSSYTDNSNCAYPYFGTYYPYAYVGLGHSRFFVPFWGDPYYWDASYWDPFYDGYWGDPYYWAYDPFFYYPYYGFRIGTGFNHRFGYYNYGYFHNRHNTGSNSVAKVNQQNSTPPQRNSSQFNSRGSRSFGYGRSGGFGRGGGHGRFR